MIVTRQYTITYDAVREVYKLQSKEVPICPKCGAVMAGHGIRRRHAIDSSGTSRWFELRRWRCPVCQSVHLELPDFMAPRRHYGIDVIRDVQAGGGESCPADDSTIRRWKNAKQLPGSPVPPEARPVCLNGTGAEEETT